MASASSQTRHEAGGERSLRVDAPGKLNLFLEVLSKRNDGFHEIVTLMIAVSIYDTLYFTTNSEGQLKFGCKWASGMEAGSAAAGEDLNATLGDIPSSEGNLVWKVLDRFRRVTGVKPGATVRLVKRIPAASGLGGASSDAAAVLVAANRAWDVGWTNCRLSKLAAELGSDIPFFLGGGAYGNQLAICRGRGEQVEIVPRMPRLHFVVVRPPVGLSTPVVYAKCRAGDPPVSVVTLLEAIRFGDAAKIRSGLLNRLESAAEELSPWITRLRTEFARLNVMGHQMSGSGTAYFGICRNARQARRIAAMLRASRLGYVFQARSTFPSCRIAAVPA